VKILFLARHYTYLRLFESAIEGLAARGHEVVLAADRKEQIGGQAMIERLASRFPNVRLAQTPRRRDERGAEVARQVRLGIDYLRFLRPEFAQTPHLRARARERAPRVVVRWSESPLAGLVGGVDGIRAGLRLMERGLPVPPEVEEFMRAEAPDLVMITPLVDIGSSQLDYLAATRKLGLRTVLPVGSWDYLSSKSLLRDVPERIIVWNEAQRSEAIEMHGVDPWRVVVTGAQCYDQWFNRQPSRDRDAFCARVGLRADKPFVLYVCSSLFRGTTHEPTFVRDWVRAIRSSTDPRLRGVGILIRPHPSRLDEWQGMDLSYENLTFWGAHPVDEEAKDDYFDSMFHSAAVVGVNTSAFIEAAVVGVPVHTVLLPHISKDNQEGTLHFHHLLEVGGGLLRAARSFDEHLTSLADSCETTVRPDPKAERFVASFVRPYGRGEAATPRFVAAVEEAAASSVAGPGLASWLGRLLLLSVRASLARGSEAWTSASRKKRRRKPHAVAQPGPDLQT